MCSVTSSYDRHLSGVVSRSAVQYASCPCPYFVFLYMILMKKNEQFLRRLTSPWYIHRQSIPCQRYYMNLNTNNWLQQIVFNSNGWGEKWRISFFNETRCIVCSETNIFKSMYTPNRTWELGKIYGSISSTVSIAIQIQWNNEMLLSVTSIVARRSVQIL